MIEILAGEDIEIAFKALGIDAELTYDGDYYKVYELTDEDYEKLCAIKDDSWDDNWGWWRFAKGSCIEFEPIDKLIIDGHKLCAQYSGGRRWEEMTQCDEDEVFCPNVVYEDFFEYCLEEQGVSTHNNICAIAVSLARLNNMTMGELLNLVGGGK